MSDATERPADADPHPRSSSAGGASASGSGGSEGSVGGDRSGAGTGARPDADAWAKACQEDLAAERARRRERNGTPPGSAAEELRRLADAVAERFAEISAPLAGSAAQGAAQGVAQQLFGRVRAAIDPVLERNPRVFDHLAAAGQELLAAYRTAAQGHEQRWTRGSGPDEAAPGRDPQGPQGPQGRPGPEQEEKSGRGGPDDGPSGTERIHLD